MLRVSETDVLQYFWRLFQHYGRINTVSCLWLGFCDFSIKINFRSPFGFFHLLPVELRANSKESLRSYRNITNQDSTGGYRSDTKPRGSTLDHPLLVLGAHVEIALVQPASLTKGEFILVSPGAIHTARGLGPCQRNRWTTEVYR
ncbi:hypothetical protein RRG08_005021 [Elysia crispata]|uniref:Uncharacterized protein n=1 Tax=Elysia crispata TaxID=231223 RepID=A0AAE1B3Q8_9GAST|nr:hypothetical protein RRG08_005021 [Elysia crispata]